MHISVCCLQFLPNYLLLCVRVLFVDCACVKDADKLVHEDVVCCLLLSFFGDWMCW